MSIATPTPAMPVRYSPNSFFSMATPTAVMRHMHQQQQQQCNHLQQPAPAGVAAASPIVATPRKKTAATPLAKMNTTIGMKLAERPVPKKQQQRQSAARPQFQQQQQIATMASFSSLFVTPPRQPPPPVHRSGHHLIRREHSASAITIPKQRPSNNNWGQQQQQYSNNHGNGFVPFAARRYTPPSAPVIQDHSPPMFAGSKFIESPSAKSLPLPPPQWLEEQRKQRSAKEQKVEEESEGEDEAAVTKIEKDQGQSGGEGHTSASESGGEQQFPGKWSPPATTDMPATTTDHRTPNGVRMHPLHLIAAAVSWST